MKLLKFFKRQLIIFCSFLKGQGMLLIFFLFPEWTFLLDQGSTLPKRDRRIEKKTNPFDEFTLWEQWSDKLPPISEVNVIMGGVSFDRKQLKNIKGPKYLVNWTEKVDLPDVIYTTSDQNYLRSFFEKNMLPVLFVFVESIERVQKRSLFSSTETYLKDKRCSQIWCVASDRSNGTGIDVIVALEKYAKKINIYGWDHYMPSEPRNNSFHELYSILNNHVTLHHCDQIVGNLKAFNYAIRFKDVRKINNYGYSSKMAAFPGLAKRLEKVFYN